MPLEAGRRGAFPLDQSYDGSCRGGAPTQRNLRCPGPENLPRPFDTRDWPVSLPNNMVERSSPGRPAAHHACSAAMHIVKGNRDVIGFLFLLDTIGTPGPKAK